MRQRGQSTLELAMALPFIVFLLMVTLQGGLLISDHVNLEHSAYNGVEWAQSHLDYATVGNNGAGTISQHIIADLCAGGTATAPGPGASRYCNSDLSVVVIGTALTANAAPVAAPTSQVLAAGCGPVHPYKIASGQTSATVTAGGAGGTGNATFTLAIQDIPSVGVGQLEPTVTLAASGYPTSLLDSPFFNPPQISRDTAPTTSVLNIQTSTRTRPGVYRITISGVDQCGKGASGASLVVTLTVLPPTVAPPAPPAIVNHLLSVNPSAICSNIPTGIDLIGDGFTKTTSKTVKVGPDSATAVTVISDTHMQATIIATKLGYNNVELTSDSDSVTLLSAVVVLSCPVGTTLPPPDLGSTTSTSISGSVQFDQNGNVSLCAGGAAGAREVKVSITWREPLVIPGLLGQAPFQLTASQFGFCQR